VGRRDRGKKNREGWRTTTPLAPVLFTLRGTSRPAEGLKKDVRLRHHSKTKKKKRQDSVVYGILEISKKKGTRGSKKGKPRMVA